MNLAGVPILLAALASLHYAGDDGSTNGMRTVYGALGVLVILAVVIGIGVLMSGSSRPAR
jgi:hypothetical protein